MKIILLGTERNILLHSPEFLNRGHCRHLDSTIILLCWTVFCLQALSTLAPWAINDSITHYLVDQVEMSPDNSEHTLRERQY